MPTTPNQTEPARQGQRILDRLLLLLHNLCHRAHDARVRREAATTKLQELNTNHPEFANISFRNLATYLIVPVFIVFAFVVDYYLDGPTIAYFARHYLASHGGGVSESAINRARIALPLGFLFLDLVIAAQLHHAREAWADGETSRGPYLTWLVVALVTSLALAGLVAAAQVALRPDPFTELTRLPFYIRVVSVTFVAWLLHAVLIFGGRVLSESKAFVLYSIRRGWLRSSISGDERTFESNARQATQGFGRYLRAYNTHRAAYPEIAGGGPGPFDRAVRDLINERLGYRAIQTDGEAAASAPNAASPAGEAPPQAPAAAHEPAGTEATRPQEAPNTVGPEPFRERRPETRDDVQAERDYLRDVLNQRVTEDESTVRI